MSYLQKLQSTSLDQNLLAQHSNNHERRKYIRTLLTKELLKELIEEKQYSCLFICDEILLPLGIITQAGQIITLCKEFDIRTRSLKESANNKQIRQKYEKTCVEKYGTKNALSKKSLSYTKRNETVMMKYGVSNVFQLKSVIEKSKETMFEKYGVYSTAELPDYERCNGRKSKIHKTIETLLTERGVSFLSEVSGKFRAFNEYRKKYYSPIVDILIEQSKTVIEIYGDLWHANPAVYKKDDLFTLWEGILSAEEIWKKDKSRQTQIESFGYKFIVLWERDILKNLPKVLLQLKEVTSENSKD